MTTVAHLAQTLQTVLTSSANSAARATGFVQRQSKLTGAAFVQALVFGWLANPQASLEALAQAAVVAGVAISPQGLDQRFTEGAAVFLEQVLNAALRAVVAAEPVAIPLLERFTAVVLLDCSTIVLPAALAPWWPGCGGTPGTSATNGAAALKLQVRFDLCCGSLTGPLLLDARTHDCRTPLQTAPLPAGALRIADLGFFDLSVFAAMAAQGVHWLSRLHASPTVYDRAGRVWEVPRLLARHGGTAIDLPVLLGAEQRLAARLLAVRVSDEVANARRRRIRSEAARRGQTPSATRLAWAAWTILVTDVPPEGLSLREALVLARARWQIELLFKLWKSHGHIDESRSAKPWRILCEVYAKLLAMLIQHWLLLIGCWAYPNRSLIKAAQTIRQHALHLASALPCTASLCTAITVIQRCLAAGCRLNRRKTKPNTYQRLLEPSLVGLA
jgi:hypothetical protein